MKILIIWLFLATFLAGETSVFEDSADFVPANEDVPVQNIDELFSSVTPVAKSLELSYVKKPDRIYIGEVIEVSIKLTPVDIASGNVEYSLAGERGLKIFSDAPKRVVRSDGIIDTFSFVVESTNARLPDIRANADGASGVLDGSTLEPRELAPPADYAGILANKLDILNYKSTPYDGESNVVIFSAKAYKTNITKFNIKHALKQGFESKNINADESQFTYYAIIPNSHQTLSFSYFNLLKQRYEPVNIPIIVDDDLVSTGISDLSPYDTRKTTLKVTIAFIASAILFVMFYLRRKKWYIYLSILPMFYIIYALLPNKTICIRENAPVYLLPIKNGTIFDMTSEQTHLESEKVVGEFIKVHINDKVGWINKNDLCSN